MEAAPCRAAPCRAACPADADGLRAVRAGTGWDRLGYLLQELLLPHLQLQHDGAQLHVQIVGPLELSLIVLSNIQRMSVSENTG